MDLNRAIIKQQRRDTKRQLTLLLEEKQRRRGLIDLHYFCKKILHYEDLTDKNRFHGDFCRNLEGDSKFKLSLTPRGTLKSSIGTIGHSLQQIVKRPNIRILFASETYKISVKFLSELKGHIEKNETFIKMYGNLVGDELWNQDEIIVNTRTNWKKEPTISCAGIDVTKVGMHYDLIKVDDPQSDKNTQNQDQIDKVIRWYRLLLSLLDPGGNLDINGTIWHFSDLYNYLIHKEEERQEKGRNRRFVVFTRDSFTGTTEQLMNDEIAEDKLLWPERLSADFLRDQYIDQGPYIFSCQYRLNPIDDENAYFKRSWIRSCRLDAVPKNLAKFSTIDPMRDDDGKDYLAITTCGIDQYWRAYLLDVRRLKADEHDTVEEMISVYKKFRPEKMGMETVAWQRSFYRYVKLLYAMKKIRLPMVQLKTDTKVSKKMRIKSMVPYWKSGLFIIPCRNGDINNLTGNKKIFFDELTRYPKSSNDDTVDALAYMNQLAHRPTALKILRHIPENSFIAIRARNKAKKKMKIGRHNLKEGVEQYAA